ncbi:uncharacterized protein LOC116430443 [Nomia melanderi]|uniref:uncharacterized protein LOC116430443 n=1 Tax=Nomia melanderi TaxID=2448451 RepID=UPI003FCD5C8A
MQTDRSRNTTMGVHLLAQMNALQNVFTEVIHFLECLGEVNLPIPLKSFRDDLLIRSKQTLMRFMAEKIGTQTTSEPYLNMSPIALKGLVTVNEIETELGEYVVAEEHQKQKQQDYYESFQTVESNHAAILAAECAPQQSHAKDEKIEHELLEIYANFPAAQAKIKCSKFGPLDRKEGKRLFTFGQYRKCWVGLIESCLLIYGSDRDNRPYIVLPIRGYAARAAPNAIPKDQRRSGSTFEIFCPGNRTFQFVAKSPKEMEQWIVKIYEMGIVERNENAELRKVSVAAPLEANVPKVNARVEEHQNVGCSGVDKAKSELAANLTGTDTKAIDSLSKNLLPSVSSSAAAVVLDVASATVTSVSSVASASTPTPASVPGPSLPARIPRRLPALPTASYVSQEEEEDDMYYKIEDFRNTTRTRNYKNVPIGKANRIEREPRLNDPRGNQVCSDVKDTSVLVEKPKRNLDNAERPTGSQSGTMCNNDSDNISSAASTLNNDNVGRVDKRDKCYDDAESLRLSPRSSNDRPNTSASDKPVEPAKSPDKLQKKSFLHRVRNLKESPRKAEKKATKRVTPTPPAVDEQQLPTYDKVSALINTRQVKGTICSEEEKSEYTCPPPPRPIYANPPVVVDSVDQQELYDDVSYYRINHKEQETLQPVRVTPRKLNCTQGSTRRNLDDSVSCKNIDRLESPVSLDQMEHYQTPRLKSNQREHCTDQQEELYDDIAILAECLARKKEFKDSKDVEETGKVQVATEKRSCNRFIGEKKPKSIDFTTVQETNPRNRNGIEQVDDHAATKMNNIQKLISKMENSFGKAAVKSTPTLLNKTNATDNV